MTTNDGERSQGGGARFRTQRLVAIVMLLLLAAGAIAFQRGLFSKQRSYAPKNAIMVIAPYRYQGTWVFDDPAAGLVREPFVAGIPKMIDVLVADIPDAESGFRLLFSAQDFPGHQKKLTWTRPDNGGGGNYYRLEDPPMEGWLCPSLFKYFAEAPKELYVKAEAKK